MFPTTLISPGTINPEWQGKGRVDNDILDLYVTNIEQQEKYILIMLVELLPLCQLSFCLLSLVQYLSSEVQRAQHG